VTGFRSDTGTDDEMPATQHDPVAPESEDPAEAATTLEPAGSGTGSVAPATGGARPHTTLQPGWRLGERYEIVSVLGAGGMGIVYRARDLKLLRDVALKVIRPDLLQDAAVSERFRREILLSSQITHKNILRVHDLGESDGLSYISMNFVEGETLQDLLKREGPLDPEKVVSLAIQLCDAMAAAHDASVIHRDLKPQNILLDKEGTAYIADFGISRSLDSGETMTRQGAVLGTVDYMSPEQARGETPDHRGDIYSLGMVLYRILAGAMPFENEELSSITAMLRRVQEEVPDIQTRRPDVPNWLAIIVSRALRRDPVDRYQSMAEMRHDLEQHTATVSWRQILKPRRVLTAAALIVALAVVAVAVTLAPRFLSSGKDGAIATLAAPKASLALLPINNATGDAGLDWASNGLLDLVHTDLLQTGALRVVEADRVRSVFDGLKIGATGDLRPDILQRVAGLLGADNVMTASLFKAGDTFRIEATLQRVTGSTVSPGTPIRVEGQGEDSLFAMVDELTTKIRDDLGLSTRRGEKDVTEVSTGSLDALKLYQQGLEHARTGNHLEAASLLEQALEKDPEFAVAHASLAETYDELGQFDEAVAEADKALQSLNKVSSHEAQRIRAIKAWLDYDLDAAESAYTELTRISPNSAAAYLGLATVQEERGDLEGARDSVQRVLLLDPKHADAQYALGRVHAKLGNSAEALAQLSAALVTHMETSNDQGRATVLNGMGNIYLSISEYQEAHDNYEKSLEIRQRIGDRRGTSTSLGNIAAVAARQGQFDQAIDRQTEALEILQELGDPAGRAEAYSSLGDFYQGAGKPEQALNSYQESMKILRDLDDEASLAWNLSSVGYINTVLGNYVMAFPFLKEALAKRREFGDKTAVMLSLNDIGILEQTQGRYEEAIKYNLEGLQLARENNDREGQIALSLNLSRIDEDQGAYGAALARLAEAQATARQIEEKRLIASSLADTGATLARLGDLTRAKAALDEALDLATEMDDPSLLAKIFCDRSDLLRASGQQDQAAAASREALSAAQRAKDHRLMLTARLSAAVSAGSAVQLQEVCAEAESSGVMPLVTQGRLALARLHLGARRPREAQQEAEKAVESATELNQRDLLFQAHHLAGKSLAEREEQESALAHYLAALEALEEVRAGLEEDTLAALLARQQTVEFRSEAEELIRALNRPEAAERLRQIAQ